MADDVDVQAEGVQTLHLREMRRQWQVVTLQMIATVAVILLYLFMVRTYDIIDQTTPLTNLNEELESGGNKLPTMNGPFAWFTGFEDVDGTATPLEGDARFFGPLLLAMLIGGGFALLAFQSQKLQRRVKLGLLITTIVVLAGEFVLDYLLVELLFGWQLVPPSENQLEVLITPIGLLLELIIVLVFTSPVVFGTRGVWGLRRTAVKWSLVLVILFIGIHAVLTWSVIADLIGNAGGGLDITPLSSQVGDPTVFGLIDEQQLSLILISMLLILFAESAFGVIRYLDYAFRLPESCKRDPEYVRQFYNTLNGHLVHTAAFMLVAAMACAFALRFNEILLDLIKPLGDSQWSRQVAESLELQLTYGLVISALLFLGFMALLRYIVPWTRITGMLETVNPFRRRA